MGSLVLNTHTSLAAMNVRSSLALQREDLDDMRADVQLFITQANGMFTSVDKGLAQMTDAKAALERQNAILKKTLEDKEQAREAAVRSAVAEKETENARLKGEVERLRAVRDARQRSDDESSQAMAELQRQLEEAQAEAREVRRQQSSQQATAGTSQSDMLSLKSMIEAKEAEVLRLQEEAEAASRSHQARLAELQDSFRTKIKELRRVHEEQLSASQRQAEPSQVAKEADKQSLADEHAAAREEATALRKQLADMKAENGRHLTQSGQTEADLKTDIDGLEKDVLKWKAQAETLSKRAKDAETKLQEAGSSSKPGGGSAAPMQMGAEMMSMMEAQLTSLSQMIRTKDQELEHLRATVKQQCDERIEMMLELNQARGKGGAGKGASGPPEQGSSSGPSSPTGRGRGMSTTSRAGGVAAPGSPWRTKRSGWH